MARHKVIKGKNLYQIIFYGVILTVISVGLLVLWGVREVRHDAAVVAVKSSVRGLSGTVTVLVNAVTSSNREIGSHNISSLKPAKLRKSLMGAMTEHSMLVSVMVSDDRGLHYMLTRRDDGVMEGTPEKDKASSLHWYYVGKDGAIQDRGLDTKFDLPAANAALADEFAHLQPGQINWRSAYRFHELGESWVTASTLAQVGGRNVMISYVFPVDRVVKQLSGADKGGAEKVFLFWESGKVLPVAVIGEDKPVAVVEENDPVVEAAMAHLKKQAATFNKPFSFQMDEETWWAYVQPLTVFGDTISLGVAVPLRNIVSTLTSDTFLQAFGGLLVLIAAGALFVLHRNRGSIEAMGRRRGAAKTSEEVLHLIAEGESGKLEFKQTLRFNLKAGKNGREIEHAALKTVAGFMNSEGGTLLVGVADTGEITGFTEDRFESADKALLHFNNLVNQYIGTEFSRYLNTSLIEVQGKEVLRVHCIPAGTPAFLMQGKNEEFYVRSGPASRQLTIRQFYEWLQEH